ncbi:response regulator, partial [Roseomonas oryzicola]|nr:response regulator [Neoroseomonas oryzicola]
AVETVLRTRHVPHVYMSGAPVRTDRPESVVLQKPFTEAEMSLAIERAVGASAEA